MAEPILATPPSATAPVDRERFSLHPEEHMTERPSHRLQASYLAFALRRLLRGWFVAANMGVYWVPGEMEYPSVGPDVLVARNTPAREDPAVYLTYEDGALTLVAEIASPSTRNMDRLKRDNIYAAELAVPWYLWIDLPRRVLELYRLVAGRYEPVAPDEAERLWCPDLDLAFAWDRTERLVRVLGRDGSVMPTEDEEAERREAAELRAAHEADRRAAAEQRAAQEAEQRAAAEQTAAELAAEVERLRRALEQTVKPVDTDQP